MSLRDLPTLNALLNTTSAVLLMVGVRQIYAKNVEVHKRLMVSAFLVSTLFLISYLIYHFNVGSVGLHRRGLDPQGVFLHPHHAFGPGRPRAAHGDHHPLPGVAGGFSSGTAASPAGPTPSGSTFPGRASWSTCSYMFSTRGHERIPARPETRGAPCDVPEMSRTPLHGAIPHAREMPGLRLPHRA